MNSEKQIKDRLQEVMSQEVHLLRELLANMDLEQNAILLNDTGSLKAVMEQRESHLYKIGQMRQERLQKIEELAVLIHGDKEGKNLVKSSADLDLLLSSLDSDSCVILSLRDQIVGLLEKMNERNTRNNYLLQNKISFNKEMIESLYPKEENTTYGPQGGYKAKQKSTAVTIINREG